MKNEPQTQSPMMNRKGFLSVLGNVLRKMADSKNTMKKCEANVLCVDRIRIYDFHLRIQVLYDEIQNLASFGLKPH